MEQDKAVKKMMLDIKLEELIPPKYYPFIAPRFEQMWLVGWEHCRKELTAHNKKRVARFDTSGKRIGEYESVIEAAHKTKSGVTGLYSALLRGTKTKKGYYWRYLD
jgi:hypothetical protein